MEVGGSAWFLKWNAGSWPAPPVQDANSTGWAAADALAAAEFEACCALPWPALLPGALPLPTGSAAPVALAEADWAECSELLCPSVAPCSVGSLAADALAAAELEACCALPTRRVKPS